MPEIALSEMSAEQYAAYTERCLAGYIAEGARATSMTPEAAEKFGRKQFAQLLPDGQQTKGQHFCNLTTPAGEVVGQLWFAEELHLDPPRVFLYEIVIDERQRGHGFGSLAMRLLEDEARRLGANVVALHVFTHNEGAIRLYQRLGYQTDDSGKGGMHMSKTL